MGDNYTFSLYSDFDKKMLIPKYHCNQVKEKVKSKEDHDSTLSSNLQEVDALEELTGEGDVKSA